MSAVPLDLHDVFLVRGNVDAVCVRLLDPEHAHGRSWREDEVLASFESEIGASHASSSR